jgi:outer membrane biosynthesis protein TonB
MDSVRPSKTEQLISYIRRRGRFLALGLLISLASHLALLLITPPVKSIKPSERVPITLEIKKKPKTSPTEADREEKKKESKKEKEKEKEEDEKKQIIEAPLIPTEAPDEPAHLGRQNHKAERVQKTEPQNTIRGADSSALQNGRLRIEGGLPDKKGSVEIPAKVGSKYSGLLPQQGDLVNLSHNDYIHNPNIPKGVILDVNTTDFRWIGYFTSVRKLVELAFTDIGPSLRSSPYVKTLLSQVGKVSFQGESKIRLKVVRSGLLSETKLVSSSGDKDIDDFWNKILNLAAPYPPLPKDFPEDELMFTYTLYYDIVVQNEERVRRFVY